MQLGSEPVIHLRFRHPCAGILLPVYPQSPDCPSCFSSQLAKHMPGSAPLETAPSLTLLAQGVFCCRIILGWTPTLVPLVKRLFCKTADLESLPLRPKHPMPRRAADFTAQTCPVHFCLICAVHPALHHSRGGAGLCRGGCVESANPITAVTCF